MAYELVKRKDRLAERRDDGKENNFLKIPENTESVVLFLQTLYRLFLYMAYPKYSNFSRKTGGNILSRAYRLFRVDSTSVTPPLDTRVQFSRHEVFSLTQNKSRELSK